jgi:hypothetical protein
MTARRVCPNCGQWQHARTVERTITRLDAWGIRREIGGSQCQTWDCVNECAGRGFAPAKPKGVRR